MAATDKVTRVDQEHARPGADVDLVPLYVPQAFAEAVESLCDALAESPRFYHDCELALQRVQRGKDGPLTDVLEAMRGDV